MDSTEFNTQMSADTSNFDTVTSVEQCNYQYNPAHYDTYGLPSEMSIQSTCIRTDLNPTVQFDHFFRAAISSSLKPYPWKRAIEGINTKYQDGEKEKNQKAYEENETAIRIYSNDPKQKLFEMYEEIDNTIITTPESAEVENNKNNGCVSKNEKAEVKSDSKIEQQKFAENEHRGRFAVIHIVEPDEEHEKYSNNVNLTTPQNSLNPVIFKNESFLKPENVKPRKRFSIASIFENSLSSSKDQVRVEDRKTSFSQIMDSCIAMHQIKTETKLQDKPKSINKAKRKSVHFTLHDIHDEETIAEIKKKLIEEGLPDLESCIITEKEVSRRKQKHQHIKDKISGFIFTFIIFGIVLTLGTFLTFRLLKEFLKLDIEPTTDDIDENMYVQVNIDCNTYIGIKFGDAMSFRGIPYADPGIKRWKKQTKNTCTVNANKQNVVNATNYGSMCMQLTRDGQVLGSEDCLFINIWTRSLNTDSRLPVVVFIHDGGFLTGSGNLDVDYNLYNFMAEKIVLISFNYRLNIFGFFVSGAQANFGLNDQIIALNWIIENVKYFGGDSNKITILGHEAGALSALILTLSEKSYGLFRNAWISHLPNQALKFKSINFTIAKMKFQDYFFKKFNCTNYNCLRTLDSQMLCKSYKHFMQSESYDLQSDFIIDSNIFNRGTEKFFEQINQAKKEGVEMFRNGVNNPMSNTILFPNVTIIFGTSYKRPLTSNRSDIDTLCNLHRLFKHMSDQPQVSLLHYNLEFNETSVFNLESQEAADSIDVRAIIDHSSRFDNYGEHAIEFQKVLRTKFINVAMGYAKKLNWHEYPQESLVMNPNLTKTNNFFKNMCL